MDDKLCFGAFSVPNLVIYNCAECDMLQSCADEAERRKKSLRDFVRLGTTKAQHTGHPWPPERRKR